MSKKQELYSIFKAIRSATSRYKTYPSNYADKLNKIMYKKNQGSKYKLAEGGAPTMQQFFDYGHPTPGLPYIFDVGGQASAAAMMAGQQSGQLPVFQMGQSFAENQKQDASMYGYMAMGGSASNSASTFPNEKLGKFLGAVKGKAKTAIEKELMQNYDSAMSQPMGMPMAAWGGGFDESTAGIDYDKLSKVNAMFNQKAPDVAGAFTNLQNALSDQYVKEINISDLSPEEQYWKSGQGMESFGNVQNYAPDVNNVYNPTPVQQRYGGVPMYYGGGGFDKYKSSGSSMLEIKSKKDLTDLQNHINTVLGMPGQYSVADVEAARYYSDLLNRDYKRIDQALSTGKTSVSLNAPGEAAYSPNKSEWTVNNSADPQGVYTWQNNSQAKPTIGVKGNKVVTRGKTAGQPLAVKTGEASYKKNPNITEQENIQAQDAADQQVKYPLAGYYSDSPRRQYTTDPNELNQPGPEYIMEGRMMPPLEITAPSSQRDLSFPEDNPDEIANWVPNEDPSYGRKPSVMDLDPLTRKMIFDNTPYGGFDVMTGPDGQYMPDRSFINQDEQDLMMMDIAQRNAANDPANAPFMKLDALSRRMILDNTPNGGYGTVQNADGTYSPDRSFANQDEQDLMMAEINQRNQTTPLQAVSNEPPAVPATKKPAAGETPLIEGKWMPPLEVKASEDDPTAGMTRDERLAYHRSKRNLAENTQMLGEAHANSKAVKDQAIADHNEKEKAKLDAVADKKAYGGIPKYTPGGPTRNPYFQVPYYFRPEPKPADFKGNYAAYQAALDGYNRDVDAEYNNWLKTPAGQKAQKSWSANPMNLPTGAAISTDSPIDHAIMAIASPKTAISDAISIGRALKGVADDATQQVNPNTQALPQNTNTSVGPFTGNLGQAGPGEAPIVFDNVAHWGQQAMAAGTAINGARQNVAVNNDPKKTNAPQQKETPKKQEAPSTTGGKKQEAPSTTTGSGTGTGTGTATGSGTATGTGSSTTTTTPGTGSATTTTTPSTPATGSASAAGAAPTAQAQAQTQVQQQMMYGQPRVAAIENKWRWNPLGKYDPASGRRHGQAKSTRIEFGYGMPAVGPTQGPAATPQQSAQNLRNVFQSQVQQQGPGAGSIITAPAYDHSVSAQERTAQKAKDAEIAAKEAAALQRQRAQEAAAPAQVAAPAPVAASTAEANVMRIPGFAGAFTPEQIQNMNQAPSSTTKAFGGALSRFVGGGGFGTNWGVDPTKFNQDVYNEMAKAKGPAPEGMVDPTLVTTAADYTYGRDNADVALAGIQGLTALKQRADYNKQAAQLPNDLSAANIFTMQNTRESGINNARGQYNFQGDLGIGSKDTGMMMSKYGGDENSEGNIYFLDEDTIRQIMAMGGTVEYLD